MSPVNCPHCRAPLVEGARFCPACGQANAPTESGSSWPAARGDGAPDLVGKEIAGRYRILKKLGEGGMGAVYRAEQMALKRAVAVKVLRPELGANQQILQRFNAEAQAVAKLSHPNTVNIFDYGHDADGTLFIAMEFIDGRSLREALQKEGPFSLQRALAIAMQVAAALSDAHAHSIVHRDLKPDNVMLQERGKQKDVVRVLDFGIAKLRDDNRATQVAMTQAGDMLGTPQYMAPEQIKGEAIDGRTDVYALGCLIYEMVTARLPYEAPTIMAMLSKHLLEMPVPPTQRRPDLGLPPALDSLVMAAMAKEPKDRPATMDAFSDMIAGLLAAFGDPNRSGGLPSGALATPSAQLGVPGVASLNGAAGYSTPAPLGYAPTPLPSSAVGPAPFVPSTPPPGAPAMPPPPGPPPGAPGLPPPSMPPPSMPPPAGAPPVLPPPGPSSYSPYPVAAPTAAVASASPKSRAPLYAILGVLALGGAGAGIYVATRGSSSASTTAKASPTTPTSPVAEPSPPPPVPTAPPGRSPHGADPWGDPGGSTATPGPSTPTPPAPPTPSVGTAQVPIPKGAYIIPPSGFIKQSDDPSTGVAYIDKTRGVVVAMAPLYGGTNDPDELAQKYAADVGVTFFEKDTLVSAGATRPALAFTGEANGVPVVHLAALYISDRYRLGVLVIAKAELFADEEFQQRMEAFFRDNVRLP